MKKSLPQYTPGFWTRWPTLLECTKSSEGENLQDQLAYLDEEEPNEGDASFRLLRHYAESVRHQKYNSIDVVWVRVSEGYSGRTRLG